MRNARIIGRFLLNSKRIMLLGLIGFILTAGGTAKIASGDEREGRGTLINFQVFTASFIDETLGSLTPMKLASPLFIYVKQSGTSILKVIYQDTVANSGVPKSTCQYQLRIDDTSSVPNNISSTPLLVVSNIVNTSLSSAGIFQGLAEGPHQISIWMRSVEATQCIRNSGGFNTTIIVEEFGTKHKGRD